MLFLSDYKKFIWGVFFAVVLFSSVGLYAQVQTKTIYKDNVLEIPEVSSPPVIDGNGNDVCWENINWQDINEVWIPYGGKVDSKDYSGRYKIAWSFKENLLYFLVEIIDDVAVDGYIKGQTADVYNFDILEVFIDEDKSGGFHVFDGTGDIGRDWGTNAENAFAYHIYAKFPEEGGVTKDFFAYDIAGHGWEDKQGPNYAAHFPEFALRKTGNLYTREFSLKVYNDTYEDDNPDSARVQLKAGKEMGLSLAYCDNDDPNEEPKTRDNFFGSVWVPKKAYNDHWKNASDFRAAKLVSNLNTVLRNDGKLSFLRADGSIITSIDIEIAETPESQTQGLMGRELPDFSSGMLFVYLDVKPRNFWMRNTPGSLDMIFVGEDSRIVNIAKETKPMSDQVYSSKLPVKYVVEVKTGFAEKYGINENTKIRWEKS